MLLELVLFDNILHKTSSENNNLKLLSFKVLKMFLINNLFHKRK